uniref:C-X-C motif chemokine n=1 Tax=Vombatus ursinus TaxID=29139 RepID=A0A4X2KL36_VOMUR
MLLAPGEFRACLLFSPPVYRFGSEYQYASRGKWTSRGYRPPSTVKPSQLPLAIPRTPTPLALVQAERCHSDGYVLPLHGSPRCASLAQSGAGAPWSPSLGWEGWRAASPTPLRGGGLCAFFLSQGMLRRILTVISLFWASGAPVANELRCQCLQTVQGVAYKSIANLKVIPAGPHCSSLEVIATLKNGNQLCLNPAAPQVKKIVEKVLKR